MKTPKQLLSKGLKATILNILVFGPQVANISTNDRTRNLQLKRIQIRQELEKLGHSVKYAEDIVDPNLPSPQNNSFLQEIVIMPEFDIIIILVDSPGSIVEMTLIACKPTLAQKSSLFIDSEYSTGLTAEACRLAKGFGADLNTFNYPQDLVECNLLGFVKLRVQKAQIAKLIS